MGNEHHHHHFLSSKKKKENSNDIIEKEEEKENEKESESFLHGTNYEEELFSNFKYFNIFWFDPNKSHDFDHFIKYFENVQIYKGFDIETVLNFFKKESSIEEWIVITPGTKGEELVSKLHENKSIKAFCVFCFNPQFHQEWVKKYEKIKCLTNDPITLTEKFIELNKEYLIPNFNYDEKINKKKIDFDLNFNPKDLKPNNKFSLNSVLREFSDLNKSFNKNQNKYNIFCMKTLHYLKKENCFDDFIKTIKNENVPFYKYVENIKIEETERIKKIIKFVENITLISLYFSKYPYLLNLFSSQEIKNLLIEDITPKNYMKLYNDEVYEISEKFCEKINKNESILNDKEDLKKIQIFCILFTYFGLARYRKKEFLDYHQITNFYRDIDFCLKFLIFYIYLIFDDKKNKFISDLNSSLNVCDFRVTYFMVYANSKLKNFKNTLNEEDQRIVDESLNIKDFLVIGDINFRNNVKAIENKIKTKSIKYLTIDEISDYIYNKNINDSRKEVDNYVTFYYYLIINPDDFKENLGKINLLSAELGLTFVILIYIENEDEILFNKIPIKIPLNLTVILVYSIEDIINYVSKRIQFNMIEGIKELLEKDSEFIEFSKISIPKINFDNNNNEDYQDGCFELGENFDINIVKSKIFHIFTENLIDISSFGYNLYLTYSDNNALDLFYKHIDQYIGFGNNPEIVILEVSEAKKILYIYCREEEKAKKSFYYMVNYDLRTRNPSKIYRYLDIFAFFNKLIENEELAYYKGRVYRATKLDEKLIMKLEPGSTMVNTTFWSTSKDINIAEGFFQEHKWRNAFIYCNTIKNNIDIDYENINFFSEKEVLFLPFTEFRVEKISIEKKFDRKAFIIEITELGTKSHVNIENMQVININDINYMEFSNQYYIKKRDEERNEENQKEIINLNLKEDEKEKNEENNENIRNKTDQENDIRKKRGQKEKIIRRSKNIKEVKIENNILRK